MSSVENNENTPFDEDEQNMTYENTESKYESKSRHRTTSNQLNILEKVALTALKPDKAMRLKLSDELGMTQRQVQIWFQNRRAKLKKSKQMTSENNMKKKITKTHKKMKNSMSMPDVERFASFNNQYIEDPSRMMKQNYYTDYYTQMPEQHYERMEHSEQYPVNQEMMKYGYFENSFNAPYFQDQPENYYMNNTYENIYYNTNQDYGSNINYESVDEYNNHPSAFYDGSLDNLNNQQFYQNDNSETERKKK